MRFDEHGREILDQTPVARTVGFERPPSMQELIQRYVRTELSRQASQAGEESFEEADDFDVDDDPELKSPYEVDEGLPRWQESEQRQRAIEEAESRFLQKQKRNSEKPEPPPGGERSELEADLEAAPASKPSRTVL